MPSSPAKVPDGPGDVTRVLVVEADPQMCEHLTSRLEESRYEVRCVTEGGEAALEAARKFGADVLLVNVALLGALDGLESGRTLADTLGLPLVYLTDRTDDEILQEIRIGLPFGLLVQPVDRSELKGAIELALLRHRMDEALRRKEERYRILFERNLAGVFRKRLDGRILECNRALAEILGFDSPGQLRTTPFQSLFHDPQDWEHLRGRLEEEGSVTNFELLLKKKNGSLVWVLENSTLVEEPEGSPVIVGSVIDITERKRLEDELEKMAYHDPLTGLPNRRFLELKAAQALALADRSGAPVGIVFIDLVRFKEVNDRRGHASGDDLLRQVARRLHASLRASDTAARVGGDEFVVVLTQVENPKGAKEAARRLLSCFALPFSLPAGPWELDARMGVVLYPDHGSTFLDLVGKADRVMSSVKARDESVLLFYGGEDEPIEEMVLRGEPTRPRAGEVPVADGDDSGVAGDTA